MSERKRLTIAKAVDVVRGVAVPATVAEWTMHTPGEFPAACRFCGDPVSIELLNEDGRVRVAVSHDVPLCPEFVRYCEDV